MQCTQLFFCGNLNCFLPLPADIDGQFAFSGALSQNLPGYAITGTALLYCFGFVTK